MNLISFLHRKIPRLTLSKCHFQFRTFTRIPPHDLEIDSIQSISANPIFNLLKLCRTLSSLQKFHALLIVSGETEDPLLKTKLVGQYGLFGQVKTARLLFDEIPNPDYDSCKVMIRWYFMNDLHDEIIGFYKFMCGRFYVLDNAVISIVLKACSELMDFVEGRKLHGYIVQMGSPDSFVYKGLVDMYAKCGEIETARKVFERMPDGYVFCWTSMIVGYVKSNFAKEALMLFNRMRDCLVGGNSDILGSIVTACAKLGALHQGRWVHGNVIKNGIEVNSRLFSSLLDMYLKCGAIQDARLILDEIHIIDLVSWNAVIVGYAMNGFSEEALLLFINKKWQEVHPNSDTLASVLSACAQLGNPIFGSLIHGFGIKLGQDDGNFMYALVNMYAKCCRIEDAVRLFESIPDKDVDSWNFIIRGYSQNGYASEALRLLNSMRSNCFQPDPVTVVSLLSACSFLGEIQFGFSLHAYSIKKGLLASNSVYICTALLNLYSTCGDAKSARTIFAEVAEKQAVVWSGSSNECLEIFSDMLKEKMEPIDIVFTSILSACSRTGMIKEGWKYFDKMCEEYNFIPLIRHYACVVELLARSGNLEEALEFIEKMPIEPDSTVFGAFIHGCSMYSRFDLGDLAVKKMLELYPDATGNYMIISNLYDSKRKRNRSSQLRGLMKMRKKYACSRVDLYNSESYSQGEVSFG